MRLTLDYRTGSTPRAGFGRCILLAGNLLGLTFCLVAPVALSLAGLYWRSTALVVVGFVASGLCLVCALLCAVTAVETICDLVD